MPDPVAASLRLAPEALTRPFSAEQFSFTTTNDLEPFRGVLGQERAVEALQFGVAMPRPGYNVFVMGEPFTIKARRITVSTFSRRRSLRPSHSTWRLCRR